MNRLTIIGASGHGKVVADIAVLNGYNDIVFLDDNECITECAGFPVVGKSTDVPEGEVFVAIGDSEIRMRLCEMNKDKKQPVLIHPDSVVANEVEIGIGTVIMAGAVINPGSRIGRGVIVNTCSSIDHDCIIGNFVHVSVGAHLCGTVMVGDNTFIGAGSTIINNVTICSDCMIGAGSVVVKSIMTPGRYLGVPASKK